MAAIAAFGSKAQAVRRVITRNGGKTETDRIRTLAKRKSGQKGGLLEKIKDEVDKSSNSLGDYLGGVLSDVANLLSNINVRGVYGLFVAGAIALFSFNINTTDDEFEQAIKDRERQWYGQLGETAGRFVGWFLCGAVPGMIIGTFNEAMMLSVLADVGQEAFDDLSDSLGDLLRLGAEHQMKNAAARIFMGMRALVKRAANGEADTLLGGALIALFNRFPKLKEIVKQWGEKGAKPWSINSAINEWVESFPEGNKKEFLEEFLEALGESCIEAGYVVAGGVDDWIMRQKVAQQQMQGRHRVVDVLLDRSDPGSRVIVAGREQEIMQTLIQQKNNYIQLKEREIGISLSGQDLEEVIYNKKNSEKVDNLMIKIRLFSNQKPPFYKGSRDKNKRFQKVEITVPRVERSKLDWDKIKRAVGGETGYSYGSYKMTGFLVDHTGLPVGKIIVSGSSEDKACDRIEDLAKLTDCKVNNFERGGQVKRGERGKLLWVDPIKVYPADVTIINAQKIVDKKEGRKEQTGNYKRTSLKISLWEDKEPDNWNKEIMKLFSND